MDYSFFIFAVKTSHIMRNIFKGGHYYDHITLLRISYIYYSCVGMRADGCAVVCITYCSYRIGRKGH